MSATKNPTFKRDGCEIQSGFRIRLLERKSGRMYQVDLGRASGKHIRKSFKTADDARNYADQAVAKKNKGLQALDLPDRLRLQAIEALKILDATDATLIDAARFYLKYNQKAEKETILKELATVYLKDMEARKLRERTIQDTRSKLNRLCKDFGHLPAFSITAENLDAWLDTQGFSPVYRNNFKRNFGVFFNWMAQNDYIEYSPVSKMRKVKIPKETPEIWTPKETKKILSKAIKQVLSDEAKAQPEIVLYLAIGFFAGIRPKEIEGLEWKDLDLELNEIHIRSEISKTHEARIVHITDNLKAWLEAHPNKTGKIFPHSESSLKRWRKEVFDATGFDKWIQDGTRHSFATYHLALHESMDKTTLELGYSSSEMLFKHYRGLAKNRKAQAEIYFDIYPESIIPALWGTRIRVNNADQTSKGAGSAYLCQA